nr:M50 family metallopeptidase [Cerasicoccus arenae]
MVFVSVALHELGHCLTAQHYGIKVPRIVLMAIGGMAQMGSIPREPRKELIITINGPLVNFAIAIVLFLLLALKHHDFGYVAQGLANTLKQYVSSAPVRVPYRPWSLTWDTFVWGLLAWNVAMGLFNLLPIFPMDGGRLLRASLATRLPYLRATQIASLLAKILAAIGIGWALLISHHYLLAILFVFIWIGGEEELKFVRIIDQYAGKTIRDVMVRPPNDLTNVQFAKLQLAPDWLVDDYTAALFSNAGATFAVYGGGEVIGVVYSDELWDAALPPSRRTVS